MLDAGVAITTEKDSYTAGKIVGREALEGMKLKPKLAILAVDALSRRKFNYEMIIKGIREEIGPDVTIIGSTVNGILVNDRFALRSIGLMLIGGDISIDSSFNKPKSRIDYENIAEYIYQENLKLDPVDNRFLLLFQDGIKFPPEIFAKQNSLNSRVVTFLSGIVKRFFKKELDEMKEKGMGMPSVQEMLEELYKKGWNSPVIGNVASNIRDYDSVEFYNNEVGTDNVVGAILSGKGSTQFGFGYAAGAEFTGKSVIPDKNIGNFILRANGKPALLGLCSAVGIEKEALNELRGAGFLNYHIILGTTELVGNEEKIHLTATITDPNLESLINTGFPFDKVPNEIKIFQSNMKILHKTAQTAVSQAIENLSNPKFLLGFDCAIRFVAYGDNFPKIVKTIDDTMGKDIPRMIVGSGGEVFGTSDFNYYFNNVTFVTLAGGD